MFWTGRWGVYYSWRQKAMRGSSEKVYWRKAFCCRSWLSSSLFRDNYHWPIPCRNPFTFQIIGVGSKIKEVQADTGVRCWKQGRLTSNSLKATARKYGDTVCIRKRHPCLQVGRVSYQGTQLGSEGGWQCLFPPVLYVGATCLIMSSSPSSPVSWSPLLLQTPMPGRITIYGDWLISVLLLPINSI